MCGKWCIRCVNCNQHPFIICFALKDELMISKDNIAITSMAKSIASGSDMDHFFDLFGQCIRFWCIEAWAESIVIVRSFYSFLTPFTSIINARNTRHTKKKSVSQREVVLVGQDTCNPGYIVVVNKRHQMFSTVNAPLLRSVLTVQRVCDLKHVHAVEAGINAFIAFIVGAAVQHFVIDDLIVIPEENLSDQCKVRF